MPHSWPAVFLLALAVLGVVVVVGSVRYSRSLAPVRARLSAQPADVSTAVLVKQRLWPGFWSTRTLAGMRLETHPGHAWVSLGPRTRRLLPGTEWIFVADTTSVGTLRRLGADWVVLSGPSGSRSASVALRSPSDTAAVARALAHAGFEIPADPERLAP